MDYFNKYIKYVKKNELMKGGNDLDDIFRYMLNDINGMRYFINRKEDDMMNQQKYITFLLLIFSNMSFFNSPHKLLQSQTYDEFKKQGELTVQACTYYNNLYEDWSIPRTYRCSQNQINNFNSVESRAQSVCPPNYPNTDLDNNFNNHVHYRFLRKLEICNVVFYQEIINNPVFNAIRENDSTVFIIDYENLTHAFGKHRRTDDDNFCSYYRHVLGVLAEYTSNTSYAINISQQSIGCQADINISLDKFDRANKFNIQHICPPNDASDTKCDIDDILIIYIYLYFTTLGKKCIIMSNDTYKWISFPLHKYSSPFDDDVIRTYTNILFRTSCSNFIKNLYFNHSIRQYLIELFGPIFEFDGTATYKNSFLLNSQDYDKIDLYYNNVKTFLNELHNVYIYGQSLIQ